MSKMTKIDIITRPEKFEALKQALNEIGVTGMTVYQVLGCGIQKGKTEFYRGAPLEINLLPKIKLETVVCEVPVSEVIRVAKEVLYTGEIGDGKIFVYDVENVIKIRTGEEGVRAL
ncbi:MAG: P-II family nitrogen regulator [Clostridia bacterium]|nr:P-II family nitrogen regulator [Clostridia bacterium]